ncbi:hypothetical protein [Phytoactinopolyspora mesophila]|uniref:Uncharacterized protein n=1 Tax=Phytoactinopolyspora mesophila TaxID=2650750 RepID=A0A7K3M1A8_9ACTN|nr:hypothetical protein [Phytoactinopolyspora mesophila]NDL57030.1 hypothetical protein [Phytoactinopolyspora mesophila]
MTRQTRSGSGERGAVSLAVTVLAIALIALIGLVHDGGLKVQAMQRADNAAAEAARAAGQHITGNDLLGGIGLDRAAAVAAASSYLKQAGIHGTVAISGDTITVTTQTTEPTVWLSIIGVSSVTGRGQATVRIGEDI